MKKLAIAAAAAGAGLVGLALAPTVAQARPVQPSPSVSLSWSACTDESLSGLECASLKVPLDHSKPHGQQITLALSRFKHTGTTGYQGAMLVVSHDADFIRGLSPQREITMPQAQVRLFS